MDEMVSYIFRSMRSSELTLRGVKIPLFDKSHTFCRRF